MSMRCWMVLVAALLPVALAGCGGASGGGGATDGRPTVVATTTMIADAARIVGGDDVAVVSIMKEGQDPHDYDVLPGDASAIAEADLVLMNGLHLEATLTHIIDEQAGGPVARLAEHEMIEVLNEEGTGEAAPDPHCWMDVRYFKLYVEGIRDALIELDPDHADGYRERTASYLDELDVLDAWVREQIATIPESQRVVISSHDAFRYYGAAYGLEVYGVGDISAGSQVTARHINQLEALVRDRSVPAVFGETSTRDSLNNQIQQIADHTDAVVSDTKLLSDSLGPDGTPEGTYIGMIRHNTATIVEALRGE